jgi:ribosome modulation factor
MTRKDNVEYFDGRSMFKAGVSHEDCPYPRNLKKDSRYRRWLLGWFDEQAATREANTKIY